MDLLSPALLRRTVSANVADSLTEDVGDGDLTAQLIPAQQRVVAQVMTREFTIMAGRPWAEEVFRQVDPTIQMEWHAHDGDAVNAGAVLLKLSGPARALMTAERAALNWLQTLSGVATRCRRYADRVTHTNVRLLDTRKTLPGLRLAQKYAVRCGGCHNHRFGLFDAFLIKENHIAACGSITRAVEEARRIAPERPVEVEAETPQELDEAVRAGADIVMLDEFSLEDTSTAVRRYGNAVTLEASGGITESNLATIAETGVHCISLGTLTKDVTAIDLSLRVLHQE